MEHRKIIHVDMDAFYASVEQHDYPEWKGKPIVVGGSGPRGVIAAASYEAREFGVRSAMSGALALKRCPELIFVPPRFSRYKEVSQQIRTVFYSYTDLVEPLALDEAFLDVTQNKKGSKSATLLAQSIREEIFNTTGLTASAGISNNKFLAKIASNINKPNGQKTIHPSEVQGFLDTLEIKKFFGIGKKTAERMYHLGIFTGYDLRMKTLDFLTIHFGHSGASYYRLSRGIHDTEVQPHRLPKSIGAERTFEKNLSSEILLIEKLENITKEVEFRLKKQDVSGKTITLKIKYSDFTLQTRSYTYPYFINEASIILQTAKELLFQQKLQNSVRLIGVQISNLNVQQKKAKYIQLKLDLK